MARVIRSGRTLHELVEVAPSHCPAGHRLGAGQVLVGYGIRPDGVRARQWICRACGVITWDA